MTASELAVEAHRLGKDYGSLTGVDRVDLEVRPGEFFGLLGPNGAGKTTTIHMLATLLRPSRGAARVAGHDVARDPLAVRRQIGLVFQETTLDLDLTAEENLRFAAHLYALPTAEARRRIDEVLELFDLAPRRHDLVRSFSGGMRRALDLARGVLHRPGILFLDEPTLGLDPTHRRRIWAFLHRLRSESGVTLFLTTHYLEEADDCDRVAILDRGRIIVRGTPAELKRRVGHESLELDADLIDDGLVAEVWRRTGVEPQRSPRGLVVITPDAEEILPSLLPLLNGRIRALSVRRPSLEDVFVALTGRPADAEGSG
jgi:ABC-2 type transport system ATP-binding protein